jgi:hypothetical protein
MERMLMPQSGCICAEYIYSMQSSFLEKVDYFGRHSDQQYLLGMFRNTQIGVFAKLYREHASKPCASAFGSTWSFELNNVGRKGWRKIYAKIFMIHAIHSGLVLALRAGPSISVEKIAVTSES